MLFISNFYPPAHLGGMELRCQEVAEQLRQRGHTVQVLTSCFGGKASVPRDDRVCRDLYLQADIYHYRPADFFLKRPFQERANKQALRRALDQFRPDIVFVWGMWNLSQTLPYWAEQWMPGRVAYSIASYWLTDPDIHAEFWRLPTRRTGAKLLKAPLRWLALNLLRREGYPPPLRLEHVVCCSQYVRDTLVQAGKLPRARVIYSGIDLTPFPQYAADSRRPKSDVLQLLYFGSLLPKKGVHTAIQALGLLKREKRLEKVRLTILGSGHPDYEARLRYEAEVLGVSDRVDFADWVPREELPARLGQFDVFLFTSIWAEPLARTVMEAMAAGLLVIGTEVGGQVEMLFDGENGLTFLAKDAMGLADRIIRMIQDPSLRMRLAQAGQQMVREQFTLDRMITEIEQWLQTIVKSTP